MPNLVQHLRSSTPNAVPNTEQISIGEIALNLADRKIFTSNGSSVFELGANVGDLEITGGLTANGSLGTDGQVLTTNGSAIYWDTASGGGISNVVEDTSPQLGGNLDANGKKVFLDGGTVGSPGIAFNSGGGLNPGTSGMSYATNVLYLSTLGSERLRIAHGTITCNGQVHANSGLTTSPGFSFTSSTQTGMYLPDTSILGFVVGSQEMFRVNTSILSVNCAISVSGNLSANVFIANGSLGTDGQVLTTNGSAIYWADVSSNGGGVSGISNLVEDTSPELGGDLYVNNFGIRFSEEGFGFIPFEGPSIILTSNSSDSDILAYFSESISRFQKINTFEDGTISSCSIILNNDFDTGFYRPGTDTLGIVAGGVEGLRLTETDGATTLSVNSTAEFGDNILNRAKIKDYSISSGSPSFILGDMTFNYEEGPDFDFNLNVQSVDSLTFENWPATDSLGKVSIRLTQSGNLQVNFANSDIDFGDTIPVMPTGNNAILEFVVWSRDGGTTKYGGITFIKSGE